MDFSENATKASMLINDANAKDHITFREFEKIIYLLGYSDCVYPPFYSSLSDLLDLVQTQTFEVKRDLFYRIIGIRIKFAVEQADNDCPSGERDEFEQSLKRLLKMFFEVLQNLEPGNRAIKSILIGIASCSKELRIANLIRDDEG